VRPAEGFSQAAGFTGDRQQVNMIAHQAVSRDLDSVPSTILAQQLEVQGTIRIVEEHEFPTISALRGDASSRAQRRAQFLPWTEPAASGYEKSH
jgi:hypothetical protein